MAISAESLKAKFEEFISGIEEAEEDQEEIDLINLATELYQFADYLFEEGNHGDMPTVS